LYLIFFFFKKKNTLPLHIFESFGKKKKVR
jgi:hypothetical protein